MAPPAALLAVAFAVSTTTNKYEVKFNRMIDELQIPPAAVEFIDSPKQRLLFRGVAAGVQEPLVKRAFSIVYKDLVPVRVAGDLIFSQLSAVAMDASERASGITARLGELAEGEEAADAAALAASRRIFDILDGNKSGGLDRDELLASPELLALVREDGEEDGAAVDRFMELADENGDGVISFVEFANAAAIKPRIGLVDSALSAALLSSSLSEVDGKKQKMRFGRKPPEERFEEMLEECFKWEKDLGCGTDEEEVEECVVDVELEKADEDDGDDNRMLQVLKGALVGARCAPVVDALKMCYLEYSPLRLGGDIIFKLLKRVVAGEIRKIK